MAQANLTATLTASTGATLYNYTLAAGHRLELEFECPRATSQNKMMVAHDTRGYPSLLRLPWARL
jgi:hypothetical protein